MLIKKLRGKIHRARVTEARVDYVGSITVDADLLAAAGLAEGEAVLVADMANGARLETYIFRGEPGSGVICLNGAAARQIGVDDEVIIMAFGYCTPEESAALKPKVVLVDEDNRIAEVRE